MITYIFLLICLSVFVYIRFICKDDTLDTAVRLGAFFPPYIKTKNQYWRFMTCHFIHIDFLHFFMNAYAFYDLGGFFEAVLGEIPYLYLIIISMFLSALLCYSASEISERSQNTITFVASGVVYGFFGAICALAFLQGDWYMELFQDFLPVLAINFIYTIFNPQISKTGHLGGFIGGILGIVILMAMHIL